VLDLLLRAIRALLASLYMLFEGMPALEAIRSWFGERVDASGWSGLLTLMAGAALLSLLAFLLVMWWLAKRPPAIPRRTVTLPRPVPPAEVEPRRPIAEPTDQD
jgi:hypothetical protein